MPRVLKKTKSGEPQPVQPRRNWPLQVVKRTFRKRNVRTLIKQDEAKGVTLPEFGRITNQSAVTTGATTRPRVVRQHPDPQTGTPGGAGKRVHKAPLGRLKKR
jgi:hypothetical protein